MNNVLLSHALRFLQNPILRGIVSRGFPVVFGLLLSGAAFAQTADVGVSQTHAPNPMPSGGVATFTITVFNAGLSDASGVQLEGILPSGSTFVSLAPPAGITCSTFGTPTSAFSCDVGNLPHPGQVIVTLRATLPGEAVWTNTATVSSLTPDHNLGNNTSAVSVTTVGNADLNMTATSDLGSTEVAPVRTGEPYNYILTVNNAGPDNLPAGHSPTVEFEVPAGSMVRSQPTGTGWTCTPNAGYPLHHPTMVRCTRNDALLNGSSFPPITVPAVANEAQGGNITANFSVASTFPDGNPEDNLPVAIVYVHEDPFSDVGIRKTVSPTGQVAVGTNVTYTLTPTFYGGVNPTNVTVTDTLAAGLIYVSHNAPAPWDCDWDVPAVTLTCVYPGEYTGVNYSDLPVITLTATVNATGAISNTADIEADQDDPFPGNNTSTVGVTGNNTAQLVITKSPSRSPVMVGDPYAHTVTVRNSGPQPIPAGQVITVTDEIPVGMTLTGAITGTDWTCTVAGGAIVTPLPGLATITCTYTALAEIPPTGTGATLPTLTFPVVNTADGALTNTACVLARIDPDSELRCANSRVPATPVGQDADLWIEKDANSYSVAVGEPLTYTLTIGNDGPGTALDVRVGDVLNNLLAGSTVSSTTTRGTCNNLSAFTCDLGDIPQSEGATVTITIYPANTGSVAIWRGNVATVTSDTVDPDHDNNTYTISDNVNSDRRTQVHPRVDVTVEKTVTPDPVRVGEPLVYVVTARNNGPSTATNVVTTDTMPTGTAFIAAETVTGGGNCTWPAVGATSGTITCTWATILPNTQFTVEYHLRPLNGTETQTLTNTVNISTDSVETNLNNNTDSASVTVIEPRLDVLVTKAGSVNTLTLGGMITYTIRIENLGPSYGTNLVMTDTFPQLASTARFSYEGNLSAPGGICTEPAIGDLSGTIECTFPATAPGNPNVIEVTYDMQARGIVSPLGAWSGTHRNDVTVRVDETETTLANNQSAATTTATLQQVATDLGIEKSIDKAVLRVGEQAVYTLEVTNYGPLDVEVINGAIVTDPLPTGVNFVSSPDDCSLMDAISNTVMCNVGDLDVGDSKTFSIRVRIDNRVTVGTLVNEARVTVVGDTNPDNDTDTATATVLHADGVAGIPTLSHWGMALLVMLLALAAVAHRRRESLFSLRRNG
jgi:uncharacterized repeat protein (TIGR01451 family)